MAKCGYTIVDIDTHYQLGGDTLKMSCKPLRNTRQKRLIYDCLVSFGGRHVTAEEIIDSLKADGTPVGKATVYRYLKELEGKNIVKKYTVASGACSCYEYLGEKSPCLNHYHLLCEKCGQVVHFECPILDTTLGRIEQHNNFKINKKKTVFYGLCTACAAQESDEGGN